MIDRDALARLCAARDMLRTGARSVRDVARATGTSVSQLERGTKALFGTTPHQLRIAARIERAKHLLVADGLTVTAACMDTGFASVGSFSALFSRRVGVSPSVYRRTHRAHAAPGRMPDALVPGCFSLMGAAPADDDFGEAPARGRR